MKQVKMIAAMAVATWAGMAPLAEAQTRRAPAKNAASIVITNARQATLQELDITTQGEQAIVAAKLAKPLAYGKSVTLMIKGKRGCQFDIRGTFDDSTTIESDSVDLCADKTLRLTE
ncbi:MAG: hypothetical protein ACRCTD_00875 [Beijerinckiaceae bacterium]